MAHLIKVTVADIKTSKSGKSDVISLFQNESVVTALGEQSKIRWYNLWVKPGTASVDIDQELDLDLSDFDIEESVMDNGSISYWLKPAN